MRELQADRSNSQPAERFFYKHWLLVHPFCGKTHSGCSERVDPWATLCRVSSWSFAQEWGILPIMEQPVNPSWQILRDLQASGGTCVSQGHLHGYLVHLLGSWLQVWLQSTVHINSISLFILLVHSLSVRSTEQYIQPLGKSLMD